MLAARVMGSLMMSKNILKGISFHIEQCGAIGCPLSESVSLLKLKILPYPKTNLDVSSIVFPR
jgi:hypothetical protein